MRRKCAFGLEPDKAEIPPGTVFPQRTNAGKPVYWAVKALIADLRPCISVPVETTLGYPRTDVY